ncbi:MAG: ketoacyl-ACP synthase III [Gemmatimonadetes bacterium]|nr:ketoacyl-ACP synthase III [Gemmatimonadota bacterium]
MKRPYAYIAGTGRGVPSKVLRNSDFASLGLETDDEWITSRTGIRERHIGTDTENLTWMSVKAARQAMSRAGVSAGELDLIVLGTVSPDHLLPSTAVEVQAALGAGRAAAFDLVAACSGYVYGITVAENMIQAGSAETVLVIGGEKLSSIVNWKDRSTCVLFGDGAGACVLRRSRSGAKGILSTYMRSDGNLARLLWRPAGGGASPATEAAIADGSYWIHMAGREVFKHAVRSMSEAYDRALDLAKITSSQVDLLIPHQANLRIIEATAKHAGLGMERVFVNVDRYGNTSAGSIAIALDEAIEQGRVKEGMTVALVAFGAGFTWGSVVVRF